jgi:hypothetical protein
VFLVVYVLSLPFVGEGDKLLAKDSCDPLCCIVLDSMASSALSGGTVEHTPQDAVRANASVFFTPPPLYGRTTLFWTGSGLGYPLTRPTAPGKLVDKRV